MNGRVQPLKNLCTEREKKVQNNETLAAAAAVKVDSSLRKNGFERKKMNRRKFSWDAKKLKTSDNWKEVDKRIQAERKMCVRIRRKKKLFLDFGLIYFRVSNLPVYGCTS